MSEVFLYIIKYWPTPSYLWPGLAYHLVSPASSGLEPTTVLISPQLVHLCLIQRLESHHLQALGEQGYPGMGSSFGHGCLTQKELGYQLGKYRVRLPLKATSEDPSSAISIPHRDRWNQQESQYLLKATWGWGLGNKQSTRPSSMDSQPPLIPGVPGAPSGV